MKDNLNFLNILLIGVRMIKVDKAGVIPPDKYGEKKYNNTI